MRGCIRSTIFICFTALAVLFHVQVHAADVPLSSPLYPILDRLWAEGKIEGYRPGSLPISREEAADLLSGTEDGEELIRSLLGKEFQLNPWIAVEGGTDGFIADNSSGIPVSVGPVAGVEVVADPGSLSAYFDFRSPVGEDDSLFTEAYLKYQWKTLQLTFGKEDLWWGPGRRGDLLLSNNAEAREMIRIENYPAVTLPWILRYLGGLRVNFFLSRLEDNRPGIDEPIMGGLKLSIAPNENLVISANRTFLYGGSGMDEDFRAFFDAFFAREGKNGDGNVIGNQIGGISAVWRISSETQPIVIYGEVAGEDEAQYLPYKVAVIAGVYLPRLGSNRNLDVRFEVAATDFANESPVWYRHGTYPYTYKGRIMGHPLGQDASDIYVELGVYPFVNSRLALSTSWTESGVSSADSDMLMTYGIKADAWTQTYSIALEWKKEDWDSLPAGEDEGDRFALSVKRNW